MQKFIKKIYTKDSDISGIDLSYTEIHKYMEIVYKGPVISFLQRNILTDCFIEKHINKIPINLILKYQNPSEDLIWRYRKKINWYNALKYKNFSEDLLNQFIYNYKYNDYEIDLIFTYQVISFDFLSKILKTNGYKYKLHFLFGNKKLSTNFLKEVIINYKDDIDITAISSCIRCFSIKFISFFLDKVKNNQHSIKVVPNLNSPIPDWFIKRHVSVLNLKYLLDSNLEFKCNKKLVASLIEKIELLS